MIILVDAYNVLKRLYGAEIFQQHRESYIKRLARYAKKKNHTIILVFDGGFSDWPLQEKHGKILVIFSGYKQTADDVIKQYLDEKKNYDTLLVSADRELVKYAKDHDLISIDPSLFQAYVAIALEKKNDQRETWAQKEAYKISRDEVDEELDSLMQEASLKIMHKEGEVFNESGTRRPCALMPSKKDRKRYNLLKKL